MAVAGDAHGFVRERRAKQHSEEAGGERGDAQHADRLLKQSLLAVKTWHGLSFSIIVALPRVEATRYGLGGPVSSTEYSTEFHVFSTCAQRNHSVRAEGRR